MLYSDEEKQLRAQLLAAETLIRSIQDALGTAEEGEALVEVARNACRAEQELAALKADEPEIKAL